MGLQEPCCVCMYIRGLPKFGGTLMGVPITRIIVYEGLYWGPLILGNCHIVGGLYLVPKVVVGAPVWGLSAYSSPNVC